MSEGGLGDRGLCELLVQGSARTHYALYRLFCQLDTSMQNYLGAAVASLDDQVKRMQDLYAAPSPQLQLEFFASGEDLDRARKILPVLDGHKDDLPRGAVKNAALFAFASEDYQIARSFLEKTLRSSPSDSQL